MAGDEPTPALPADAGDYEVFEGSKTALGGRVADRPAAAL